jgi:carbon storage regulator
MLVLTRRLGQAVTIGVDVTVTVLEIRGCEVRIGIDAPRCIPVLRTEAVVTTGDASRMPAAGR